jgi:hypothetical protein
VSSLALQYSTRNNFPTNNIEYGGSEGIAILGGLDRLAQIPFADEPLIPEIIAKAKIYREGFRRIDGPQETRGNWDGMIGEDEQRAPVAVIAENGLRIGGLTPLLAHSLLYMNQQRQQNQPVVAIAGYTAHEFGDTLSQIRDGDYIRHTTSFVGEDVNYGPMRVRVGLTAAYDQLDQVALPKSRPEPYQVAMV